MFLSNLVGTKVIQLFLAQSDELVMTISIRIKKERSVRVARVI
jgi:hypothetical protein